MADQEQLPKQHVESPSNNESRPASPPEASPLPQSLQFTSEQLEPENEGAMDEDWVRTVRKKVEPAPDQHLEVSTPFLLFVYGPLDDTFFLTYYLGMPTAVELKRCSIHNYRLKMLGKFPALVPTKGLSVSGHAVEVQKQSQLERITKWYGAPYKFIDCKLRVMKKEGEDYAPSSKDWEPPRWVPDGDADGKVFAWAGDPDSWELRDGQWDEGWWLNLGRDRAMKTKGKTGDRELDPKDVKQRDAEEVRKEERDAEEMGLMQSELAAFRRLSLDGGHNAGKLKGKQIEGAEG